jgi:hypothetical protein
LVVIQDVAAKGQTQQSIQISKIPDNNTSDIHAIIQERMIAKILTAWGITDPRLIGAPQIVAQGFANQSATLETSWRIWHGSFIFPNLILQVQDFVNNILKDIYIHETRPSNTDFSLIISTRDLFKDKASDELLMKILTVNELRLREGYEPLEGEIGNRIVDDSLINNNII